MIKINLGSYFIADYGDKKQTGTPFLTPSMWIERLGGEGIQVNKEHFMAYMEKALDKYWKDNF